MPTDAVALAVSFLGVRDEFQAHYNQTYLEMHGLNVFVASHELRIYNAYVKGPIFFYR